MNACIPRPVRVHEEIAHASIEVILFIPEHAGHRSNAT